MPGNDGNGSDLALRERHSRGQGHTGASVTRPVQRVRGMAEQAKNKAARLIGNGLSLLLLALVLASSPAHAAGHT